MERAIVLLLACTAVEGYVGKHIFIDQRKNWDEAQAYCRLHYTDLSSVRSQSDYDMLLSVSGRGGWIGLQQDPNNETAWIWSGGGGITFEKWINGQPDNYNHTEDKVHITENAEWNDRSGASSLNFYCQITTKITVVDEEKTWEAALEHCRKNHKDLSSMVSETERFLAMRKIKARLITDRVWIGLRYLGDRWLWVNGDPLEYEAWHKRADQDHQCPMWNRCGALTKEGLWENRDCQEKLNFICY